MQFHRFALLSLSTLVAAGWVASSASATLVTSTDSFKNDTDSVPNPYSNTGAAGTVSSSDLLNGLTPVASAGNFKSESTGGLPVLTDGQFATPITRQNGTPAVGTPFDFGVFADGGPTGGTSVTYQLPGAFNLTSVAVFGGWQDSGRDEQSYTVSYATTSDPASATFIPLATVDFQPPSSPTHPQVTRVTLADDQGGIIASNVQLLKFDFNAVENNHTGYAEIDAFGTAVTPEPASLSLLGLAGVGLLARRRRA